MNYLRKIKTVLRHPECLLWLRVFRLLPDRAFLKIQYRLMTGQKLNLKNPVLFNEKIQWLKLHDRQTSFPNLADKYEVRKYIAETIGEEYLIPLLGVWDTFDEISFDSLPNQFVLKCTHDSGGVIICHDRQSFDISKAGKFFAKRLTTNYYWLGREWVYNKIKPRIIAEKLMIDESNIELKDYKLFCFAGEPQMIQVDFGRFTKHERNLYSTEWKYQHLELYYPTNPQTEIPKPACLDKMIELAQKLSANKIHVRVDFYTIRDKVYFGELTFYHGSGYEKFDPPQWDRTFGDWMELPLCDNLNGGMHKEA